MNGKYNLEKIQLNLREKKKNISQGLKGDISWKSDFSKF